MDIFKKALNEREHLLNDYGETCIRLFSGECSGKDVFTVDLYGEYILIQNFSSVNPFHDCGFLGKYIDMLSERNITVKGILVKDRTKTSEPRYLMEMRKSRLIYGDMPPEDYTVMHSGCRFSVDIVNSQHTGLFADMRNARKKLAQFYSPGMRMLNLFSYTGAFSIHALKNGVSSSVNVDLSKSILNRARLNYSLNGFDCDSRDFFHEDSSSALKYFCRKKRKFSFVIFDPPTFSRNKKGTFSVDRDYPSYLEKIHKLLGEKGLMFSCINAYNISQDTYEGYHADRWRQVFLEHEAEDFSSGTGCYLKCGLWEKK